MAEKADAAQLPKLYMACGEQDALYAANVRLADKLTALGADIRFEHWTGIHNWEFWERPFGKHWIICCKPKGRNQWTLLQE